METHKLNSEIEKGFPTRLLFILLKIIYTNKFVSLNRIAWQLKCRKKRCLYSIERLFSMILNSFCSSVSSEKQTNFKPVCKELLKIKRSSIFRKDISILLSHLITNSRNATVGTLTLKRIIELIITESNGKQNTFSQKKFKYFISQKLRKFINNSHSKRSNNLPKLIPVRIVPRSAESQLARRKLPIFSEEYQIMESIGENDVTIISGSTGSGKTTQVPQFLYEAGYADPHSDISCKRGMICVTEPRRLAAVSMATRVSQEMGFSNSEVIGFQTRFNKNISPNTRIKFMTDGVLMKELESDFLLTSYSVVCLDEAHERSVYTDILIGILSRVVRIRAERNNPLKLVIMSATLRLEDFIENRKLFPVERIPPVIHIDSRQYPVTIHFSRVTNHDYVTEALNKLISIHLTLPLGTILVFLTSKREIYSLSDRIQSEYEKLNTSKEDIFMDNSMQFTNDSNLSLQILPLHAQLSTLEQSRVFTPIPYRTRRIVVSTNVSETSLTIPDVKYVVDTGRVKRRLVDRVTGVSTFRVDWCSQASADQRAGRAGRTAAGHVYRLYSSSVFLNEFPEHTQPDILQCPLDDLYLQMKCMNIQNVSNFPFPTPPDRELLESADILLCKLGALSPKRVTDGTFYSVPTSLGRNMNNLPIAPRLARILIEYSNSLDIIHYLICIISGLSTLDQLFGDSSRIFSSYLKDSWMGDLMLILKIVCASDFEDKLTTISDVYGINDTKIIEVQKLRRLLTSSLNRLYPQLNLNQKDKLLPPDKQLQAKLCRAMLSGFGDHIANLSSQSENHSDSRTPVYECSLTSVPVYIYPFSSLFKKQTSIEWVAFIDIIESNKMYMRCLFPIELLWIPQVCDSYCTFSPPLQFPAPFYDSNSGVLKQFKQFSYHNMSWRFPPFPIQMSSSDILTYKLFAKAFLDGQVFESLFKYSQLLRYPTQCLVKPWGKYLKETGNIVNTLRSRNVMSKVTIQNEWSTDSMFLFKEYCNWLPSNVTSQISTFWPPNS